MKKRFLIISLLLTAVAVAHAQYREGYYDAMDGKKKEALKAATKTCVQNHTRLEYYDLPYNWRYTDVYPETYDGNIRWWEMYSNNIYLIFPNQTPVQSFSANRMQREHSVPKSWWKANNDVEYTPAYTDLWNLLPSDGACNQAKSNYPFGNVAEGKEVYDNGSALVGAPVSGQGGGCAYVFEPADEYKGDFARDIFYMACVYDDLPWAYRYMFNPNPWPTLSPWAYETMLEWHRLDPVSQKEIDRNNAVESQQGNRNPFIDFPNLAEYIWGARTNDVFYLSEQESTQVPIPGETSITQPVNNEALDFGECAQGGERTVYLEIHGMITETMTVYLTGVDRAMFTLGSNSVSPNQLNFTGTYLLPVTFSPTSTGNKEARLVLQDGGMKGSIAVLLQGKGCEVPQLSRLTAYEPIDPEGTTYIANWSVAPEVIDYYVVTRTVYGEDGFETETLEANESRLLIQRAGDGMEAYSVQSSRLGYLSEASNTITVAPDAGIFTMDAPYPFNVETKQGGFSLTGGCDEVEIRVYDLSGGLVYSSPGLATGEFVSLPSGLYLVFSPYLNRPFKVLIP